jgi:hypothetical protein
MLTKKEFDKLPLGEIFATGVLPNSPEGLFMTNSNSGKMLRWIAKKGWGYDWCIYCYWDEWDTEEIAQSGDKVTSELHIKKCVPCTDEIFKIYRY